MSGSKKEEVCCPPFDPEPWDGKEVKFNDKLFAKAHVLSFFHVPLNFGSVFSKTMKKLEEAKAVPEKFISLTDENSLFGADVYLSASKEVQDLEFEKISGTFLSKVFEGSYDKMGEWIKEVQDYAKSKGKEAKKLLFWYTTCPKCAQKYGKNYTVIFAQVE